ncbi:MAG: hypothetical protein M0P49_04895 [Bacilli bacterium]|nr:hypothetical protein [Bacilli bacterium]
MGYAHGQKWTDELIENRIYESMKVLKISRMPTRSEVDKVFNNKSLSNKISKTLGFMGWAEKLALPVKTSDSVKGWAYEEQAIKDIEENLHIKGELTPVKSPYDVSVGYCRIDVKMSNKVYNEATGYYYTFNINDNNCGSDFYIIYCVDNNKVQKIYIVPRIVLKNKKQFSIGIYKSKYDEYLNRWDLIEKFNANYKQWLNDNKISIQ